MRRLIVFDCDGTLVDSQQLIVEAARQTLLAHGLEPLEASAVRAVIGLSLELALAQLVPDADERMLISLVATYRASSSLCSRAPGRSWTSWTATVICWASRPASRVPVCCRCWIITA